MRRAVWARLRAGVFPARYWHVPLTQRRLQQSPFAEHANGGALQLGRRNDSHVPRGNSHRGDEEESGACVAAPRCCPRLETAYPYRWGAAAGTAMNPQLHSGPQRYAKVRTSHPRVQRRPRVPVPLLLRRRTSVSISSDALFSSFHELVERLGAWLGPQFGGRSVSNDTEPKTRDHADSALIHGSRLLHNRPQVPVTTRKEKAINPGTNLSRAIRAIGGCDVESPDGSSRIPVIDISVAA